MAEILIAVPVLSRPGRAAPLVESVREAQTVETRVVFLCSPGDDAEIAACQASGADQVAVMDWQAGRGDYAKKINWVVEDSEEPWVFMAADDLCFCPGWDQRALACARDQPCVVGTNDLSNSRVVSGQHSTHSLVSRAYIMQRGTIDEPGKMLHEGYDHNYCDDELVATARSRGLFVACPQSEVPHLHPDWGKGFWDATYTKGKALFMEDKALFESRKHLWLGW